MILANATYPTPQGDLTFTLSVPEGEGPFPLVILIHGGGWVQGSKEDMLPLLPILNAKGLAAATIQYHLAPEFPFPEAVVDVRTFVRYAREHAATWNVNPTEFGALGISAGGHLALMLGVSPEPEEQVQLVVNFYGITDLTERRTRHFPGSQAFINAFLPSTEDDLAASPIHQLTPESAPVLSFHGDADDVVPYSNAVDLHHALDEVGVLNKLVTLADEGHGVTLETWQAIEVMAVDFLASELRS